MGMKRSRQKKLLLLMDEGRTTDCQGKAPPKRSLGRASWIQLQGFLEAHHDLIFTREVALEGSSQKTISLPILLLASFIFSPRAFASENLEEKKKKSLIFFSSS